VTIFYQFSLIIEFNRVIEVKFIRLIDYLIIVGTRYRCLFSADTGLALPLELINSNQKEIYTALYKKSPNSLTFCLSICRIFGFHNNTTPQSKNFLEYYI